MKLIIVESPTKARTITKFLDKKYKILSSFGHVRDLPKSTIGVDVENNFLPKYITPVKAKKNLTLLKKTAEKADSIIMATDEDREGEAIAWHLATALKIEEKDTQRIVFHEITKDAILEALEKPRHLDMHLVNAQQARRVLDRLVGYNLSPFLWRKVARGLSAGRVQSVAVKLIVEREKEILAFKANEYWSISANLKKQQGEISEFTANLFKKDEQSLDKLEIKNSAQADEIVTDLEGAKYIVETINKKETIRRPLPPFATSTLQQYSSAKLRFSSKQTMRLAQQLYEGVELGNGQSTGLITYMRTDSLNISEQSIKEAKNYISKNVGADYSKERRFKTKSKGAQEAHEAVRPTMPAVSPDSIKQYLDAQQFKLYNLIWRRFMASQMADAILDTVAIDINAAGKNSKYIFRANGSQIKFPGWLNLYAGKVEEVILPKLSENEQLDLLKLIHEQHFTQPPARYSEATLIKVLEKEGIGRPSTYAPTLSTIQDRNYIFKNEQKKLQPTEIGTKVNEILSEHFPEIVDVKFTAKMEAEFDEVAEGKIEWTSVLNEFYNPFIKNLEKKQIVVADRKKVEETTNKICPKCGGAIVIKSGRFGRFYACSKFPDCRHTEAIVKSTKIPCPKCSQGELVERRMKKRKVFFGCNRYPDCDYATWGNPNSPNKEEENVSEEDIT
ncbi:MAG: type I DNA topoisomerase [Candidatus Portnoybacteria bacterium CG10_big_fil_rev_8_21_14_0_10_36_7]|uniref:DNA topoisomerase 1 n=1 Tax=Candidatus Portnoybacteria bacterium CG10_big_fil_rev_8_21_14_0_10_36_7 TaxID=1974812 RepID=A0A2M8KE88_9BACT|nr:MAG: type I DNA topoisomerase [Candidatus Portnoybacteria bacterium CG10_big_fil_rev_8_21_14_0_10_36_7]